MRYLSILLLSGVSLLLSGLPAAAQLAPPNEGFRSGTCTSS